MKFLKWIGAAIAFLAGMMLVSNARRNRQRSEAITNRELTELSKTKNANLKKAAKLGDKADALIQKANKSAERAKAVAEELERVDATPLADRMRRFNDGL